MANESVSTSKLAVGLINSIDIQDNITSAITVVSDTNNAKSEVETVINFLAGTPINLKILDIKAKLEGASIVQDAQQQIAQDLPYVINQSFEQAQWGKLGWIMASAMKNQKLKVFMQQNFIDTNLSILYDIPESIIKQKAKEYYLSLYRPANPSEGLTIEQYIRGNMTATQAAHFLAINGVPDDFAMWLYDSYEKYPSIREMAIASQFINITDAELLANMKYSGITLQKNKDFYLNYMHAVQLRTELNNYLAQLKQDYNAGLMTQAELIAEIAKHKPNAAEQAQIVANCDKQRTRTLLNMEVQSRTWLYRKGVFGVNATDGEAETAFYYALIEVGMEALFANALARFEACKLGYNWERV